MNLSSVGWCKLSRGSKLESRNSRKSAARRLGRKGDGGGWRWIFNEAYGAATTVSLSLHPPLYGAYSTVISVASLISIWTLTTHRPRALRPRSRDPSTNQPRFFSSLSPRPACVNRERYADTYVRDAYSYVRGLRNPRSSYTALRLLRVPAIGKSLQTSFKLLGPDRYRPALETNESGKEQGGL